jgi:glycosyltransferase involved in cell wall biosynthesis
LSTRDVLRVLLAPSAYYPHVGGIEETTRQLALKLVEHGHRTAVLTNRWPEGVAATEVLGGVEVTRMPFPLPAARPKPAARFAVTAPVAALSLLRHLRRSRWDVIHAIGAGPQAAYLAFVAPVVGTPLVFTAQGELTFDADDAFRRSLTLRVALRRMLRRARAVTACSAYVLRSLDAFACTDARADIVPNGVDPGDFAPRDPKFRGTYVLGIGRLVPQKGFDTLLEAFARAELEALELRIAGDGIERERLEARAQTLQLGGRVRFLGSVDRAEVARLVRDAAVFAFPSRGEPFGIALLEAMAGGVPAVAAAAGGIPELVRDGENALLVPPDDPDALARALERVADDEHLRARLSEGGRATARGLNWAHIAERYEAIYHRVVSTA